MTIEKFAASLYRMFKRHQRGDETIFVLKDDASEDLRELVRDMHGGSFPNDWIYATVRDAFNEISENGADAEIECDIYTSDLFAWLSDYPDAMSQCDDQMQSHRFTSLTEVLQAAQATTIADIVARCVDFAADGCEAADAEPDADEYVEKDIQS